MQRESMAIVPHGEVLVPPIALPARPTESVDELFSDLITYIHDLRPDEDLAPLEKAYQFAADRHKDQKRSSGEPYMVHPLLVTRQLADMSMDMVCLETGLLHDVVEDTTATIDEIRREFGDEVAR